MNPPNRTLLPRIFIFGLLGLLTLASAAIVHAEVADDAGTDPVIESVRRMLDQDLSEAVILGWLDASTEHPRLPTADELVALRDAGASDALLTRLLSMAKTPPTAPPAASAPAPRDAASSRPHHARSQPAQPRAAQPSTSQPSPASPATTSPSTTPSAPAAGAALSGLATEILPPGDASAEGTPVQFNLSYRPDFDEDEDEWGLYIYLDGKPLSYVPASSLIGRSREVKFERRLPPGRHVLWVLQERHVRRFKSWYHAARVADGAFEFDLAAGRGAVIEVAFKQAVFNLGGSADPVSYRFVQGENVTVRERVGGDPDEWALLCEEVEANDSSAKPSKRTRRLLEGCSRWASLWTGLGDGAEVPSRDEVRESLALFKYRPIPKNELSDS